MSVDFLGWILRSWLAVMSFLDWLWSARRTDSVEEPKGRSGATKPADTGSSRRLLKLEQLGEFELLPGIANDITLDLISTKLNWSDLRVLSSVSPGWRKAIKHHMVYDSRVRAHSAETLLIIVSGEISSTFVLKEIYTIALYSLRDKSWFHNLPPIPNMQGGIPSSSQCVSLGGKIYVLGGREDKLPHAACTRKVHVLDLAGLQMHWKECASLHDSRLGFGCGVKDGKIYVFGGSWLGELVRGAEVYDPDVNVWSRIDPGKMSPSFGHQDALAGEEVFLHGGDLHRTVALKLAQDSSAYHSGAYLIESDSGESSDDEGSVGESSENEGNEHEDLSAMFKSCEISYGFLTSDFVGALWYPTTNALFLKVYRPLEDQWYHWRLIKPFGNDGFKCVFLSQGKFHAMDHLGIHVHDPDAHSWTFLQSCHFGPRVFGPNVPLLAPCVILAVGDELFLTTRCYNKETKSYGSLILQSKGFGSKDTAMEWQIPKPFPFSRGWMSWSTVSC